jgi:hypothetical protein
VELAVVWSGSHACYVHSGIRILNSFWMLIPRSVISRYSWSQRGRFERVGATTFGRPPSSIPHPARTLLPIRCLCPDPAHDLFLLRRKSSNELCYRSFQSPMQRLSLLIKGARPSSTLQNSFRNTIQHRSLASIAATMPSATRPHLPPRQLSTTCVLSHRPRFLRC